MGWLFGGRRPNEMRDQLRVMISSAIENPILANGRFAPRDGLAAIWTVETLEAFFQSYKLSFPPASIRKIRSNFLQTISILIYINWDGWARFNEMFFLYQGPETTRDRTDRRIRHYDIQTLTREDFLGPEAGGPFLDTRSIFCPIDIEEGSVSTWDDGWRLPFLAAKSERRGGGGSGKVTKEVIAARHYCSKSGITTTEVEVARKEFNSKIDFDRERLNLAKLAKCIAQHKHVALPIATITVGHQHNMLFPLAQMDLEKFLQGHLQPPEMCDMNDLLDEVTNVVDALDHLHNRLGVSIHGYHMDLKPANILVYPDSELTERPGVGKWKITDFGLSIITPAGRRGSGDGLARDRVTETKTHLRRMHGTYQAPEVCSGPGLSRRSDVWSFGCILVRVLAFKLDGVDGLRALDDLRRKADDTIGYCDNDYFARGDPPVLNPHIENWINGLAHRSREDCPEEFLNGCVKLLLSILKIDKNARPSASEVKEELGSLKALLNVHQRPASPSEPSSEEGSSESFPPSTQPSTLYGNSLDLAFSTERLVQAIKNNDLSGIEQMCCRGTRKRRSCSVPT
ncbi:hypothetical protein ASPVEDRAFT_328348 [Aspergillus versicolor CBS 583.65]|uniref:Protein kinase domain-containing protein n=1 Tax=Aspergillus versicolor CBS 583.65 TaxID=1036611 RepID=A0A1L9PYK8_ASPVE|nr:uncharacterized protein ASPVEDRAFT_328348 [Aspergillus versicolor CBS 583.65]OJJ06553.1 hypothetical protein ASPVEDRAFT_328348 [Aspergillus versicolor CBS 583.65]